MSADNYPVEEHELRRAADSLHAFRYWSDASTVESALIELLALRRRVEAAERAYEVTRAGMLDLTEKVLPNVRAERDEANRVCEQWRQWTVATREENDKLRAEVASWKRLADIQEQSLKETCAETEWLHATLAKALTWVPRSGIPGRFKAEVEKQLAVTVNAQ